MATVRKRASENGISDDTGEFQLGDFENTAQRNKHLVSLLLESQTQAYKQNTEIHKILAQMPEIMRQTNAGIDDVKTILKDVLDKEKSLSAFRNKIFGVVKEPVGNIFYAISKFVTVALLIFAGYLAARYGVAMPNISQPLQQVGAVK